MAAIYSNGVTAVIFLASILLKGMRYLVYIRYLYASISVLVSEVELKLSINSHWDEDWRVELILDNLILIPSWELSMFRFPCNSHRQFLFEEYVAISHRYDLKGVSLKC
jgi:hypothetical protein